MSADPRMQRAMGLTVQGSSLEGDSKLQEALDIYSEAMDIWIFMYKCTIDIADARLLEFFSLR
jgi:hypothetical protein